MSASAPAMFTSTVDAGLKRLAAKHWAQVAAVMTAQGFDPNHGGVLVLPQEEEPKTPGHRPEWVCFSALVTKSKLINPRKQGLML